MRPTPGDLGMLSRWANTDWAGEEPGRIAAVIARIDRMRGPIMGAYDDARDELDRIQEYVDKLRKITDTLRAL